MSDTALRRNRAGCGITLWLMVLFGPMACALPSTPEMDFVHYVCDSGQVVMAAYPDSRRAVVRHAGRSVEMTVTRSASGARYAAEDLIWWTRGSGPGSSGTLLRVQDADRDTVVENCSVGSR